MSEIVEDDHAEQREHHHHATTVINVRWSQLVFCVAFVCLAILLCAESIVGPLLPATAPLGGMLYEVLRENSHHEGYFFAYVLTLALVLLRFIAQ